MCSMYSELLLKSECHYTIKDKRFRGKLCGNSYDLRNKR